MRQSIAILSFLAGAACADDVLSFVFPGGIDGPAPVATIVSANPSTTSAILTCPSGTPIDECGFAMGLDVEIISGTRFQASMSAVGISVSYGCDGYDTAKDVMTCTAELSGEDTQTAVLSGSDVSFITASVVEGASLLSGGASATASASASASARASAAASASVAPKSSTAAAAASSSMQTSASASSTTHAGSHASGVASATASSAGPENTGAAARFGIEGAALLALAGVAAANVF
ncbi:hypothetical protein B5807_00024 [Epicoccum nigrum]|uniref:Uncharacterized protein n=1 Tax=Epicoccum nigrum TaxID=105696 RepID=A0A1Y2ME78_EPING|nr:hypothetical protein B5807_00024 [Epicoccum nigrum]